MPPTNIYEFVKLLFGSANAEIGATNPLPVAGKQTQVSVELTRPADTTAYTAGDVWSNSTSATVLLVFAGMARSNSKGGYLTGLRAVTDKKSITPRLRVHFFSVSTPTVAADNAPSKELYADVGKKLFWVDIPAMTTPANTTDSTLSQAENMDLRKQFICAAADTALYALVETLDAFTPASAQKLTLVAFVEQE